MQPSFLRAGARCRGGGGVRTWGWQQLPATCPWLAPPVGWALAAILASRACCRQSLAPGFHPARFPHVLASFGVQAERHHATQHAQLSGSNAVWTAGVGVGAGAAVACGAGVKRCLPPAAVCLLLLGACLLLVRHRRPWQFYSVPCCCQGWDGAVAGTLGLPLAMPKPLPWPLFWSRPRTTCCPSLPPPTTPPQLLDLSRRPPAPWAASLAACKQAPFPTTTSDGSTPYFVVGAIRK